MVDVTLDGIKGIKRISVTISVLTILAAIYVIVPGSAHNVPKVGLTYDPGNHSLHIGHMSRKVTTTSAKMAWK
jgi:hypothetical protein